MNNDMNVDILSVTEDYIEKAMEFEDKNKKEIEEIKNIFLKNLDKYEKNKFIDIINYGKIEEDNIQIINDYKIETTIKEYVTISMIRDEKYKTYDIILFIPINNDNIKKAINKYVNENNKDLNKNIIYGSIDLYKIENNIDEN